MENDSATIRFTKMQGAGNDFVVINNLEKQFSDKELIQFTPALCDRKFGIGSDGLLALFPSGQDETSYRMFYRNPDGSDAGMCGNGARCLALYAHRLGFGKQHSFSVHNKRYQADIIESNRVRISFPGETTVGEIQINDQQFWNVYPGTEHIVTSVDRDQLQQEKLLTQKGRSLRHHSAFQPKGTNVNFISGVSETKIKLQTYERGVEDLTLACGTGAIASALAWHHMEKQPATETPFEVITEGGSLQVYFSFDPQTDTYSNLQLEGPAHFVFEGTYPLSA